MHDDKLREAALGRTGLQLLDGLAASPDLPDAPEVPASLRIWRDGAGWVVQWEGPRPPGRLGLVARALDEQGRPLVAEGPFRNLRGEALWARAFDDGPLYLPWGGMDRRARVTLEVRLLALGRGRARGLGSVKVDVPGPPGTRWDPLEWADPVLVLATAVIHADGTVRNQERMALRTLLDTLGLPDDVDLDLFLLRPTPADLEAATLGARLRVASWGPRTLLEALCRLAVTSGAPSKAERSLLNEIAAHLGAPSGTVERLLEGWPTVDPTEPPDVAAAWRTLGLRPGASKAEVKRHWRKRVQENHPDLVAGSDPAAREEATRITARLNGAYRMVLEHLGSDTPAPPREVARPAAPAQPPANAPRAAAPHRRRTRRWDWLGLAGGLFALALVGASAALLLAGSGP